MLRTGVIFVEGKPGAGKSFTGTERLIHEITVNKRPVYSNLPVRDRPMRQYLRSKAGDDRYLKLWTPLTEEHFHAFVARAVRMDTQFAKWKEMVKREGLKVFPRDAFDRWYATEHPEDVPVLSGDGANWVHTGAVFILDEVHLWTPQAGANKNDDLLAYASMHRHYHHLIYLLTQDTMQAAIEWRRQCIEVIRVDDASSIKLWGQVSLAKWGLRNKIARYLHYSWDNYQRSKGSNGREGSPDRCEFRWLPFYPHIFALYDSYGRTGISRRKQHKLLAQQAEEVGIEPPSSSGVVHSKIRPKRLRRTMWRTTFRLSKLAAVLFMGGVVGVVLSRGANTQPGQDDAAEQAALSETPEYNPPAPVDAIGSGWIRIGGARYEMGATYGEYRVFQLDHENGYGVLVHRDSGPSWLLVPGRDASSLGPTPEFMASVRAELGRQAGLAGPDVTTPVVNSEPTVDTGVGSDVGDDDGTASPRPGA